MLDSGEPSPVVTAEEEGHGDGVVEPGSVSAG